MSWKANYIVKTNANDTTADIQAWVSVENHSGTTFEDAKLKLVAGEVHRVIEPEERYSSFVNENRIVYSQPENDFAEETLFEYHLYTLERPTTLKNNQVKQISLLSTDSVPVKRNSFLSSQKAKTSRLS